MCNTVGWNKLFKKILWGNIWMKKKYIFAIIFIITFIPILVAVFVSLPVLECVPNSNDWIGFWAGYIGSIVGASVPIIIMNKQKDEDRSQAVLPVIAVMQINGLLCDEEMKYSYKVDYVQHFDEAYHYVLADPQHTEIRNALSDRTKWFRTEIFVKNIGKGPILNLKLEVDGAERIKSCDMICIGENETARYNLFIEGKSLRCSKTENNELIFNPGLFTEQ